MYSELVDLVDENDILTGKTKLWADANKLGLWYRGVHLGIFTKQGKILLQKRSSKILTNPNKWDFTLGGAVKSGETVENAAIRETKEEMGLLVEDSDLKKVFTYKYNHHIPSLGFHSKVFVHTFLLEIPEENDKFNLQKEEVDSAEFITLPEAKILIEEGKFTDGELIPLHPFYSTLLTAVEKI